MTQGWPEAMPAIQRIREGMRSGTPFVVAVDGRSGTGKSTLTAWMAEQIGGVHIDQDDFYSGGEIDEWRRLSPRGKADRVIDWKRVRDEVLVPLRAGRSATWRPFDWDRMSGLSPEPITAPASDLVILDGAYAARPELAPYLDLTILVTLDDATRRARLLKREGEDYVTEWHAIWDEAEDYYFGTVRPPEAFDLVIARPVTPSH